LLCLSGRKWQQEKLLQPFRQLLKIKQKTVGHLPAEKLGRSSGYRILYKTSTALANARVLW
jgi:hypothetical protein